MTLPLLNFYSLCNELSRIITVCSPQLGALPKLNFNFTNRLANSIFLCGCRALKFSEWHFQWNSLTECLVLSDAEHHPQCMIHLVLNANLFLNFCSFTANCPPLDSDKPDSHLVDWCVISAGFAIMNSK